MYALIFDSLRAAEGLLRDPLESFMRANSTLVVRTTLEHPRPWEPPFLAITFAVRPARADDVGRQTILISGNGFWGKHCRWIDDTTFEVAERISATELEVITSFVEAHAESLGVHRVEMQHPPGLERYSTSARPLETFFLYAKGCEPFLVLAEQEEPVEAAVAA